MNQTEALKIMQTEKECVERQGTVACPNRDCENCDLLLPTEKVVEAYDVAIKVLERDWIPLTTRPMTEDEKEHYADFVADNGEIFNCPLPEDGQEVLVSHGGFVWVDTFCNDCDGYYFEGLDIDDVDAWQPLPKAFEKMENVI